jgi:hypothetical protein
MLVASAAALFVPSAVQAAETITYSYDARGRLVVVDRAGSVNDGVSTNYTIDKADNWTNKTITGSTNLAGGSLEASAPGDAEGVTSDTAPIETSATALGQEQTSPPSSGPAQEPSGANQQTGGSGTENPEPAPELGAGGADEGVSVNPETSLDGAQSP